MNLLKSRKTQNTNGNKGVPYPLIFLIVSAFFVLLSWSCSKEDEPELQESKAKLGINILTEIQINEKYLESKTTCNTSDFKVSIYTAAGELIRSFEKASEIPAEIELSPGEYNILAQSPNSTAASFNNPYYLGESGNIELTANEFKTIEVTCTLANFAVVVLYSDYVKNNYSDYFTEVAVGNEILRFEKNETRLGYFFKQAVKIRSTLIYTLPNGSEYQKVLEGAINEPEKGKLYEINIDAEITEGYSALNILLDETAEKQTILINDTTSTALQSGDLLITEIMYDPVSLSDSDGEWFEIYNNSAKPVGLKNLVISNSTARHIIVSDIVLAPGDYYVLAKKDTAVNVPKYVYGSSINLTNTSGTVSIATYGTTGTDGITIASVTYDNGILFPKASGVSLSLNPLCFDKEKAKSGASWCTGNVTYNTGDMGTPGYPNNNCE